MIGVGGGSVSKQRRRVRKWPVTPELGDGQTNQGRASIKLQQIKQRPLQPSNHSLWQRWICRRNVQAAAADTTANTVQRNSANKSNDHNSCDTFATFVLARQLGNIEGARTKNETSTHEKWLGYFECKYRRLFCVCVICVLWTKAGYVVRWVPAKNRA